MSKKAIVYSRKEVAEMLRVDPRTVERWLKSGALRGYKLGKSRTSLWRIPHAEVERFTKARMKQQRKV